MLMLSVLQQAIRPPFWEVGLLGYGRYDQAFPCFFLCLEPVSYACHDDMSVAQDSRLEFVLASDEPVAV